MSDTADQVQPNTDTHSVLQALSDSDACTYAGQPIEDAAMSLQFAAAALRVQAAGLSADQALPSDVRSALHADLSMLAQRHETASAQLLSIYRDLSDIAATADDLALSWSMRLQQQLS